MVSFLCDFIYEFEQAERAVNAKMRNICMKILNVLSSTRGYLKKTITIAEWTLMSYKDRPFLETSPR